MSAYAAAGAWVVELAMMEREKREVQAKKDRAWIQRELGDVAALDYGDRTVLVALGKMNEADMRLEAFESAP